MKSTQFSQLHINTKPFHLPLLQKGLFIVILHAKRVPPHIGFICNGYYHSLTIKGAECNIQLNTLIKTIDQKKIETYFLKIVRHPVYSLDYLNDVIIDIISKNPEINTNSNTCLTPLKTFFNEYYALNSGKTDIIFTFLNNLNNNNFILEAYSLNLALETNVVNIPVYSLEELNTEIKTIKNNHF